MVFSGGQKERIYTHVYHEWCSIIYLFLVHFIFSFIILHFIFFLATSVDVERVFSTGRIILSHLRNRLSVQSIRALMCVGTWSKMGFVKTSDITDVTMLDDIEEGGIEEELEDGWDIIT